MAFGTNFVPTEEKLNLDEFAAKLQETYPELIVTWQYGKKSLAVSATGSTAAAIVNPLKKKTMVTAGTRKPHHMMLVGLSFLLFGFLIPGIIFITTLRPKQRAIQKKIFEFTKENWGKNSSF